MVTVGNPGNPADDSTGSLYGSVGYAYNIGKYEITNAQYAEFLNAVDPSGANSLNLYTSAMASSLRGGVSFLSGNPDGAKYTVKSNMGDKPVTHIAFWDAARFVNWLHNGQLGPGSTESGAYINIGNQDTFARQAGATFFLPTQDEWYKAAYYEPGASGNGYWDYPTRADTVLTMASADVSGDISNPGANVANYYNGAVWNGATGNVTTVGSAGPLSASFYGTFDQGGNVWEWTEAAAYSSGGVAERGNSGGSWNNLLTYLKASSPTSSRFYIATTKSHMVGFRVAANVPEPTTIGLLSLVLGAWTLRRQSAIRR